MLVDLKRIVAYICPFCSNISSKALSVFNFSGAEKVQLICPTHGCHETCVYITQKNSKYKLDIECPLCGETHSYSISKESFWNKPLITYKCPIAGIDIFFAGERKEVEKTLDENSDVYSDVMDDLDEEENSPFDLLYAIVERLHYLKDNHKISCTCGSEDAEFNIVNGNIIITCARCRKSKIIEPSEENLIGLLNARAIIIGN